MGTNNCLIISILQNILFYIQHKKETHTGLEQHEHEYLMKTYFHFWVNYSFKQKEFSAIIATDFI